MGESRRNSCCWKDQEYRFWQGADQVRAALDRQEMAPDVFGERKQFAAGLVGLFEYSQRMQYLLVVSGLGSCML